MGSFAGHILPGSFLLVMGLWWLFNVMNRYYRCRTSPSETYLNTSSFHVACLPWKLKYVHWEAILRMVFCAVGMAGELGTAVHQFESGYKLYYGNVQHTTMFFFFGITGITDLMISCNVPLPKHLDYVMMALAFFIEGMIFFYHLDGRLMLDLQLHHLLLIAIAGNIIMSFVEMKYRRSFLAALIRTFCILLQGTWFYQIGFILYNPNPYRGIHWLLLPESRYTERQLEKVHDQKMLITCMFTWHAAGIMLFMFLVGVAFHYFYKCADNNVRLNQREDGMQLIKTGRNGQRFISLPTNANDNESESDIEFEQARSTTAIDIE